MNTTVVTRRQKAEISHALSGQEMADMASEFMKTPPIVPMTEINSTIKETTIFLYQRSGPGTVGHWTCVIYRGSDEMEYFDSYGKNYGLGQVKQWLDRNRRLSCSSADLQKYSPQVQDCGVWVLDRLKHRDMLYPQYVAMVKAAGPNHDVFAVTDIYGK